MLLHNFNKCIISIDLCQELYKYATDQKKELRAALFLLKLLSVCISPDMPLRCAKLDATTGIVRRTKNGQKAVSVNKKNGNS